MVRISKEQNQIVPSLVEFSLNAIFMVGKLLVTEVSKKIAYDSISSRADTQFSSKDMANHLYDLKRRGYIYEKKINNEKSICITSKGKIKIAEKIAGKSVEDDVNRFLSFDIPERLHHQRDMFRRFIKRIGFRQVQQSLWVINKDVAELVESAALEYKVSDYIVYIVSNSSNIERHLIKLLK